MEGYKHIHTQTHTDTHTHTHTHTQTHTTTNKHYYDTCEYAFKKRFNNNKYSFSNESGIQLLSMHVWESK